jgi:hypothetical protein
MTVLGAAVAQVAVALALRQHAFLMPSTPKFCNIAQRCRMAVGNDQVRAWIRSAFLT